MFNLHMNLIWVTTVDLLATEVEGLCGGSLHEDIALLLQDELCK